MLPRVRRDQCRFCSSRSCHYRIWTTDLRFDEVACRKHISLLEALADSSIIGQRNHLTSSEKLKREVRLCSGD